MSEFKDSSPGADNLPMFIFRENIVSLSKVIAHLCNLSFSCGIYPEELKIAKVVCLFNLFKSEDPRYVNNYRPVSILPSFSKIMERIVTLKISEYFVRNELFSVAHYGFRQGLSTEDALRKLVDTLYDTFDEGRSAVGVFIDLAKAFDSINRNILFEKLHHYGIRGNSLQWIRSYFSNRHQYVYFNGVKSSLLPVNYGVIQGSIAGPLMFLIYINDIACCSSKIEFLLYADDTNVFVSSDGVDQSVDIMNAELKLLSSWLNCNALTLNKKKSHYIIFHRKRRKLLEKTYNISIGESLVARETCTKFLGVQVDENLSFHQHISHLIRKMAKYVPILYQTRNSLSNESLKLIYNSLIYPNLIYCISVWGSCAKIHRNQLLCLQKKIVRIISFKPKFYPSSELFRFLNFLKMDEISQYMSVCYVFKSLKRNNGIFIEYETQYNTRLSNQPRVLVLPPIFTGHSRQSIRWVGPRLWNGLPPALRVEMSYCSFKLNVKRYILSNR